MLSDVGGGTAAGEGPENNYRRLCNELMRVMLAEQLFTFVTAAPVEKPNGETLAVSGTKTKPNGRFVLRRRPATRPHQQDRSWGTASNGHRQRVGIAPPAPFHLYAIERNRGNRTLVPEQTQLFRPVGNETWVAQPRPSQ